ADRGGRPQRHRQDPRGLMTPTGLRHRLSAHDSVFLYWERPEQPMHVGECMVYRGSITAADMVRMIEERLHLLPRYRQKVVFTPLSLAHPTWEDDPDFDVRNHVDEMTLPAPGDDVVLPERAAGAVDLLRPGGARRLLDRLGPLARAAVDAGPMTVVPPPRTPFNRPISPARQFAWVELPIDEVAAVRRRLDATVNDLV